MEIALLVDVVVDVVVQIRPGESSNIPPLSAVEVYHSPQSVCANADALKNMCFMLVTLDTCHFERSPLNDDADLNM